MPLLNWLVADPEPELPPPPELLEPPQAATVIASTARLAMAREPRVRVRIVALSSLCQWPARPGSHPWPRRVVRESGANAPRTSEGKPLPTYASVVGQSRYLHRELPAG